MSKRLVRWPEQSGSDKAFESTPASPHVHKLRQRLSDKTVAALVRDFQGGASLAELQQAYSLGRGSVQKVLREQGERRRRKGLTQDELAVLVQRYEAGLTIREIATEQACRRRQCKMR